MVAGDSDGWNMPRCTCSAQPTSKATSMSPFSAEALETGARSVAPPAATPPRRRRRRNRQKTPARLRRPGRRSTPRTRGGGGPERRSLFFARWTSFIWTCVYEDHEVYAVFERGEACRGNVSARLAPGRDAKEKPKRSAGSSQKLWRTTNVARELERRLRRFGRPHARAHAERWETDLRGRTARGRASWCRRRRRARGITPALVGGCGGVSLRCAVGADDSTSERYVSGTPRCAPAGRTPPRVP